MESPSDASATITPADADILTACAGTWRKDAFQRSPRGRGAIVMALEEHGSLRDLLGLIHAAPKTGGAL
jgi:hypothetical protein